MDLLAIEWLKIKRYRTFWILLGFFLVLLLLWNYEASQGNIKLGGGRKTNGMSIVNSDYSFPLTWGSTGYWASIFIMFISIIVIILTTNEYSYRTNRQSVIDGFSKMKFYHAKVLLVVVLSVVSTLAVVLVGGLLGWQHSHSFAGFFSGFRQIGYFFLLSLDYLGFALFLSILIRKSGLSIGLFLLYSLFVETILWAIINYYADKWAVGNHHSYRPVGDLLPLQASDSLLPFPYPPLVKMMNVLPPSLSMSVYAMSTCVWCAVYYFAGRALLLPKDW